MNLFKAINNAPLRAKIDSLSKRLVSFFRQHLWLIPVLVTLLVFWRLPFTFFEQDEWQAFEVYIGSADKSIFACAEVQRPLTCFINTLEWKLFGTNATYYGLFSLLLISLISVAFYNLLRRLELPTFKAVIGASLLPLFAAGSQAITWFGAFSASLPSFLFAVLATDFLLRAIKFESYRWQFASLAMMALSLYFKEESLWMLPVMATAWWAYSKQINRPVALWSFARYVGPLIMGIVVYLLLERTRQISGSTFTGLVSATDPRQYMKDVIASLYLLPYYHLSHVLFGPEHIITFSNYFLLKIPLISAIISAVMIALFVVLLAFNRTKYRPAIFILVVWALTGFVSYAIFGKNPEFLEARYYFSTQAAVAVLLVIGLLPDQPKKLADLNTFGAAILAIIMIMNVTLIDQRLDKSLAIAKERRHVLSFIQQKTGPLPKRSVIFAETDNYGYVGQSAYILPFQNGIGTTLRVLYQGKDQDYRELAKKQGYMWDLLSQGYDEVGDIGFGYFRDMDKLTEAIAKYDIPIEGVFSFRYAGKTMIDTSQLFRGKMAILNKELTPVDKSKLKVTSNNDNGVDENHRIDKITDANPKSDWSTSQQIGAFLEFDLGQSVDKVAKVVLKTADGNSFPKAYKFEYTANGIDWVDSFTDIGTLNSNAETVIIFEPKTMQKLRITLTDARSSIFSWSVSDVNIFALKQ